MALQKLRNPSDRSNVSTASMKTGTPNMEYFWACELTGDKRIHKWSIPADELDDEDEDYIEHNLFVRSICLGAGAVDKEENIVEMQSIGESGTVHSGIVANLTKGVNPMCNLSFTIDGKSGVTFSLVEGSGPISICGNYLLEYPQDDDVDMSQTEESRLDETEELDDEDDDEEDDGEEEEMEEEKAKSKAVKRKAPAAKAKQQKQKAKMAVEDDDEDDDDEEDSEEEDEEEESEEDLKVKKGKKQDSAKKQPAKGKPPKPAQAKDVKKAAPKKVKK